MKQTARKLLSLLMTFAIMLSFAPAALADGASLTVTVTPSNNSITVSAQAPSGYTVAADAEYTWSCTSGGVNVSSQKGSSFTVGDLSNGTYAFTASVSATKDDDNSTVTLSGSGSGEVNYTPPATVDSITLNPESLSFGADETTGRSVAATISGSNIPSDAVPTWDISGSDFTVSSTSGKSVTVTPKAANTTTEVKSATLTASYGGKTGSCSITMAGIEAPTYTISVSAGTATTEVNKPVELTVTKSANAPADATVAWEIAPSTGAGVAAGAGGKYTFTATAANNYSVTAKLMQGTTELAHSTPVSIKANTPAATDFTVSIDPKSAALAPKGTVELTAKVTGSTTAPSEVVWSSSDSTIANVTQATTTSMKATVAASETKTGEVTITCKVTIDGKEQSATSKITVSNSYTATLSPTPSTSAYVYLDYWTNGTYKSFTVVPELKLNTNVVATNQYTVDYVWTLNGHNVQTDVNSSAASRTYTLYYTEQWLNPGNQANTLVCEASFKSGTTKVATAKATWTIYNGYSNATRTFTATVYDGNTGYALTETPDADGTTSIADQIDNWVRANYRDYSGGTSYRYAVYFNDRGTAYESSSSSSARGYLSAGTNWYDYADLDEVYFRPDTTVTSSSGSYKISYNITIRLYRYSSGVSDQDIPCTITFTVRQGGSSGDISYSAGLGEDVSFKVSDFESFWNGLYSRGSLSYVTFGSVSGGTVYNSSGKSVGSGSYYVSPRNTQSGLDGVYFSPSSSTSRRATTVRVPFTAYGTTSTSGSSTISRGGTVVITYINDAATKISYSTGSNGTVSLKAQDFIDAYKNATGTSSTPSNLTIQFQGVPSNGTLTYKDSSRSSSSEVRLTSSNIKSYKFTTRSTGSSQLGDVTYSGSSGRADTISYIGYIGNTATFTGEVTFNSTVTATNVGVSYTCYSTSGVALSPANFTAASSALASATYLDLGSPRSGSLVNGINNMSAANTTVMMSQMSTIIYLPSPGVTSTTDTITYTAYNASGTVVASGTISIVVSLSASPSTVYQFSDVPPIGDRSGDWYRTELTYLVGRGVVTGKGNGQFGPKDSLRYSEALKLIMNAAGYYEQEVSAAGVNWAQNYLNTAVSKGWISSNVDLNGVITRDAVAELAAKVLGLSASNTAPFADSANGWAAALYNAKILFGSGGGNGVKPNFNGGKSLYRNEMVCIVYRMYQYTGK